jgi:methylase of polypeptide subunit release factors
LNYPTPDRRAATALGAALRRVGYTESAVLDLLGDDAYGHDQDDLPLDERRLVATRFGAVVRLLFLQLPVSKESAVAALGERGVEALAAIGIAEVGDGVRVRARILPVGELLVASDDYPRDKRDDPPDYVAAYTATSRLCDCLTPRVRGGRALDVGTGSGVQALLAAPHADRVIATDVNPRALAFTELNAALNGFTNVEARRGSLFEAVAGERFDLITCNAPYVVSPENRWAYRDSGLAGDEITRRVVRAAADHLADGGFATLLGSWIGASEERADDRPLEWAKALPECDTWILSVWESDPLEHASTWNRQLAGKSAKLAAALDTWTTYLDELGAGWVSEGAILLHRRPGRRHRARVDGIDDESLEAAGEQVRRAFEARARLAELQRADDILDVRPSLAMRVQLEYELAPRRSGNAVSEARAQLAGGTSSTVDTTSGALDLLQRLDGSTTLRGLLRGASPSLRRDAVALCRELLELGALRYG